MATTTNQVYKLTGRITNRQNEPLSGLSIRADNQDSKTSERFLGEIAITDSRGCYEINFTEKDFKTGRAKSARHNVFIRVFDGDRMLGESAVERNVQRQTTINLQVDYPIENLNELARRVSGRVRDADGNVLRGVTVQAFDRDLRSEQTLGKIQTDKQGFYQIHYTASQFRQAEKESADLIVKAFADDGSLLVASPILFNAPVEAKVNLTAANAASQSSLFEKIERDIRPLLEKLKVEELEEDEKNQDLSFLAGETQFEREVLARFVLAHRLAAQALQPEFWFALLGGSFYEYVSGESLSEQLELIFKQLTSLDRNAARKSLARSFNQKEISEKFRDNTNAWITAFLKFVANQTVSDSTEPNFVKAALDDAGIKDTKKQEKFAGLLHEYRAMTPPLLEKLDQDRSFKKPEIADLRVSFELANLAQSDFSVVKAIKDEFRVRTPEQIRQLAKKSESEWVKLVKTKHADGKIKLPFEENPQTIGKAKLPAAEIYGKTLERQFREAFPTAAFAGGLERALQNGGSHGLRHAEALSKFLDNHENFELLTTPVDEFLKTDVLRDFRELAANDGFKLEVKAVQRVFKLVPTFEATDALLADDVHSAQQVYRMGESEFVRRYAAQPGFTAETARIAWNRAADTHAAVLTIVADLKALDGEALPAALQFDSEALASFPNWNNLFQTGDLCECDHCNSVISPAAYFADLLMFLKDRRAANPAQTVKDVLFRRRPDLGFLELNCDNALTPLPYIDVVCEVLEDAIAAGENDLELAGFTTVPVDPITAKTAVAAAFSAADINLGTDFSLSQVNSSDPDRWVAHGDEAAYLLNKKAGANFFAEILRNTKTNADELRAFPQYVNSKAYEKLRAAKYPLALPFDLFAEEVRAAFQKINIERWDLMRTLRGASNPNNPTDSDIAAEYFGISSDASAPFDEKRLILQANATIVGQKAAWGETGANWLKIVGNVKNFLQKTNLEYNELLSLLNLKFINPAGDIAIHHLDASCDTNQKVIEVLDAIKLDRIHRFLRLWRKLGGWKMWELDLVIRHPRIGATANPNGSLDETFLINLFYFEQLRTRLGRKATVEQVCALFGNLNTETRFTALFEKREDALYQNLFLNKRLINPLDPAFQLNSVTGDLPGSETITDHHSVILATLGLRETDLVLLTNLTKASDGTIYITDDLNLANLSFLWRHAWLSKLLKIKAEDWKILLKIFAQDISIFADPKAALEFVEKIDHVKNAGFSFDELNWLLAADRTAKAAVKEADAARFLIALRKELNAIQTEYDPAQYDFLTAAPPTDVENLIALLTTLLQKLNRDEAATQFFIASLRNEVSLETGVTGLPAGFDFPAIIKNTIQISYDESATALRFTGLMTAAEQSILLTDASLAAVTGITAYQDAIRELFAKPRLVLKFYDPIFTAPLIALPAAIDFKALPDALALKISYDVETRLLRFSGILSKDEKAALDALDADADYRNAVNILATEPQIIAPPDERIWLTDSDLDVTQTANDTFAKRLANAAVKALAYLSKTLAQNVVVEQSSAQLGLTEALTRRLLTDYVILPPNTLLSHLTNVFAATTGVVNYAAVKNTFDGWFWANRVATIWKKWKITLPDLEKIIALTTGAQLLDFKTLPLDDTKPLASIDRFLRTNRLLRLRDSLPETSITFLEVLKKLNDGDYATKADFAADVELLDESWIAPDVEALIAALDLAYPDDYLLAESWERLRRAFYFLESLNANAETVKTFAAAAMSNFHAKAIKELLRSKFGAETWLPLSTEIQDVLRERKRAALAAYLLAQPKPADAPSGKWENTNDLYAYYLLDIEMSSCQLTSRLVQASGSVQLFVQRSFMGLEPDVTVIADGAIGDSAWRWWTWMSKYRVWEANRKVFLWPENWIEPELKKDRSPFFKDLENELLQTEVNQYTVETAFQNYLEKLDGVAQLEIAGFYQEDDGDDAIIHVFGRTKGAEPHLYYYRRYDYRQWTPWEKVDLDIQGDYLIPAVINRRLYLFWPVFTEVPDESENNKLIPIPAVGATEAPIKKTWKRLRMQMAVSNYRQDKWTPKRISKDFDQSELPYTASEIINKNYWFFLTEQSTIDNQLALSYAGFSAPSSVPPPADVNYPYMSGAFEIANCQGVPKLRNYLGDFKHSIKPELVAREELPAFMKWVERGSINSLGSSEPRLDYPENDFTLENSFAAQLNTLYLTPVLNQTPWLFGMTPPWHLSYLDELLRDGLQTSGSQILRTAFSQKVIPAGTWLPFFYNDKKRTFFVLPALKRGGKRDNQIESVAYYPEIKKIFRQLENHFAEQIQTWLDNFDFSALSSDQRNEIEERMSEAFPEEEILPPFTDEQLKILIKRYLMRFFHFYLGSQSLQLFQSRRFHFKNCYHPFVCDFAKLVNNPLQGIPALMSRETQLKNSGFSFRQNYQPTPWVLDPSTENFYPKETIDFTPDGAYSPYNWELFFHVPLLIANSLSKNQRFAEARDWYHFIFNPIGIESPVQGGSAMSKYWITKPFFETTDPQYVQHRIDNILRMLAGDMSAPGYSVQASQELESQVLDWRINPFEPHRIANYRTVAYQKTVVMKYLDNLIAWADNLFLQDSMESINEATQFYIMAAEILGPRPAKIPPQAKPSRQSFNELENQFDAFSNALVEVENLVPPFSGDESVGSNSAPLPMLYFCIPQNDKMLGYWDTVADRLYKIRHCMNIEGVVRQLALFEPPIDPGALVKAVAGGMDLSSALADLNAPLPIYRFNVLLQKANDVCNDVKNLGSALLAALEKKDAEAMGLLRQSQEIQLLEAMKAAREQQIDEAKENLDAIKKSKELTQIRKQYYESREFMNKGELAAIFLNGLSIASHTAGTIADTLAGAMFLIPDFHIGGSGFGGSPHVVTKPPAGEKVAHSITRGANGLYNIATILDKSASLVSTAAGYQRRKDDWDFQKDLAVKEIEQIDKLITAAELRVSIAEKELESYLLQIENSKTINDFMRSKYTNEELYQWQIGQISGVYFQSYKLAYDLAKRAERCFRFELGLQESSYINFGYWDSLKKGLLSGENLQYDLRRLENAYLEQNRREFELTKHLSLALINPLALVKLRETGRCFLSLPEEIFDLDYPGHYFRRIKSVSLTLPCVVGPYTTISCTLRLLKNSVRVKTALSDGYARNTDEQGLPADDERFVENNIPVKSIAASNGQNDSGVFELSFRDERYLPFEGAGAISEWSLELLTDVPANNPDPANPDFGRALRQFDYNSISDAILHIKYTAREDAGEFKNAALTHLRDYFEEDGTTPSLRMFNLRQEFPTEWHRFLNPANPMDGNVLELELSPNLFSFRDAEKTLKINTISLLARCTDAGSYRVVMTPLLPPPSGSNTFTLAQSNQYGGLHFDLKENAEIEVDLAAPPVKWQLKMTRPNGGDLQEDPVTKRAEVEDMLLILGYQWE